MLINKYTKCVQWRSKLLGMVCFIVGAFHNSQFTLIIISMTPFKVKLLKHVCLSSYIIPVVLYRKS